MSERQTSDGSVAVEALTPARVARIPAPGGNAPVQVKFSPDGWLVTFLYSEEGTLVRELWAFDPQTGKRKLLLGPPGEGVTDANISARGGVAARAAARARVRRDELLMVAEG